MPETDDFECSFCSILLYNLVIGVSFAVLFGILIEEKVFYKLKLLGTG